MLYRACHGDSRAEIVNGVIRYCGPAAVRLSVFPGVVFANGTCRWLSESNAPFMTLDVGSESLNRKTNSGLRFLHLSLSTRPRLNGAQIVAYSKGKRWRGAVISKYKGTLRAGTFVARGDRGSRGRATGSVSCPTYNQSRENLTAPGSRLQNQDPLESGGL